MLDSNHQHENFSEALKPWFPDPLLKELRHMVFADANHSHDHAICKNTTIFLYFAASTSADEGSQRPDLI